jgi:hypothetical protein
VISSIVSRFDAMLVDVPGGLFAPLGFALAVRLAAPVHSPIFRGDHVFAAAGCTLAFNSEIDDVTHTSGPKTADSIFVDGKTVSPRRRRPALRYGTPGSRRRPCGKLMHAMGFFDGRRI